MKKIINLVVFLLIGIITASSQSNDYVLVDQTKVEKVINDIIIANEGASPENKGWAKQIMQDAFQSYFLNNMISVDIKSVNNKVTGMESELRTKTDSIIMLREKIETLNTKIKRLESENSTMSDSIKSKERRLKSLKNVNSSLNNDIITLNYNLKLKTDSITKLKGSVNTVTKARNLYEERFKISCDTTRELTRKMNDTIVKLNREIKDYKQLGRKLKSLEQNIENMYEKYDYIGGVNIDSIRYNIDAYRSFITFYSTGSSTDYVKPEIKQKLDYLDVVIIAEIFYQKAIKFMGNKYDEKINEELINEYNSIIINELGKLRYKQKEELELLGKALCELPQAMKHFNTEILQYLESFALVSNDGKAEYYGDVIETRITDFSKMRQYNEYYINLNNVLNNKVYDKLKRMSDVEYKKFLKNIKESL